MYRHNTTKNKSTMDDNANYQNYEHLCYCVTGGSGYLASWLIKTLLLNGYTVHATVRDPDDTRKTNFLTCLEGAKERLKLFKADLMEEASFDAAIEGCVGVFHVANPLPTPNMSQEEMIEATKKGVLNVLRSCSRASTVKRVIYTSSVCTASPMNHHNGEIEGPMDESKWTPIHLLPSQQDGPVNPLIDYSKAKTSAEKAAFQYGESNKLEVVSICPSSVGGPFLIPSFPNSCAVILSPLTGDEFLFDVLKWLRHYLGSIPMVHIEDICDANLFLMQHPHSKGRYICSAVSLSFPSFKEFCHARYPHLQLKIGEKEEEVTEMEKVAFVESCSRKLMDLGFVFKHGVEDIIDDCITASQSHEICLSKAK